MTAPERRVTASDHRAEGLAVAALAVLVALAYLALALRHRTPVVYADESGYLGNARWLTGGARWWMDGASFYGVGYPVLLVPIFLAARDPELQYRSALLLNVALCAALAVLLYALCRRVAGAGHRVALGAALAGCAYPALAVHVGIAWVEVTATVGVAALALTAVWALARPGLMSFAVHAVLVVYLVAVHGRFTLLVGVAGVLFATLFVRRPDLRWASALGLGILTLGWLAIGAVHRAVFDARWDPRPNRQPISVRDVLAAWPTDLLRSAAGQLWYLLAATAGLVVVGAVVLIRGVATSGAPPPAAIGGSAAERPSGATSRPVVGWPAGLYVGALLGSIAAVSIATVAAGVHSSAEVARVDFVFYGRYNDALVPTLVALGVCALFAPTAHRLVPPLLAGAAVAVGVLGAATVALRGQLAYVGLIQPLTMAGLVPFLGIGPGSRVEQSFVLPITLGAIAVIALLAALALVRPVLVLPALLAGFLWVAYQDVVPASTTLTINDAASPVYRELRQRRPSTIAYDLDVNFVNTYYGLPFWFDDTTFIAFRTSSGQWPAAELYVGPATWPAGEAHGLRLLSIDPITKQGYWVPA